MFFFQEDLPVHISLKGMCENSTRKITWENNDNLNLEPIFLSDPRVAELEEGISILLTVVHITTQENHQIFEYIRAGNNSHVLDLIDQHLGVNAVDEWGQTALMIAVTNQNLDVFASLLNTRMPKVNVNVAKSVSFDKTAL
jgi:ankyrin repeat protein